MPELLNDIRSISNILVAPENEVIWKALQYVFGTITAALVVIKMIRRARGLDIALLVGVVGIIVSTALYYSTPEAPPGSGEQGTAHAKQEKHTGADQQDNKKDERGSKAAIAPVRARISTSGNTLALLGGSAQVTDILVVDIPQKVKSPRRVKVEKKWWMLNGSHRRSL